MLKDDKKVDAKTVDIVVHSQQIKKLILKQIKDYNISPLRLCHACGIGFDELRHYMNTNSPTVYKLSHYEIMRVMKALGLRLRLQIIVEDSGPDNRLRADKKYYESDITEQNNSGITEQLSKITGVEPTLFRNYVGPGDNGSGDNGGGNEEKMPTGDKGVDAKPEINLGQDIGIQKTGSGNMATRYEIWKEHGTQ